MRSWLPLMILVAAVVWSAGCIDDRNYAGAGGVCRSTAECGAGLICVDQTCEEVVDPLVTPGRDATYADAIGRDASDTAFPDLPEPVDTGTRPDTNVPDTNVPDVQPDLPDPDGGLGCIPGEAECMSNDTIRVCNADGQTYTRTPCATGTFCERGVCVRRDECLDLDGDGFPAGPGCTGSIDCNDSDPRSYPAAPEACDLMDNNCDGQLDEGVRRSCQSPCGPGWENCTNGRWGACTAPPPRPEVCGNGIDDDCNGRVDDGCTTCCTIDSCGVNQICDGCNCLDAPPDQCLFQNQPCDPWTAGQSGDFICADFADGRNGLCMGLCLLNTPDPDSTCPQDGSICAFEIDFNQGICLDECDPVNMTGCFPGSTCLALGSGGGCVPAGDLQQGEPCDINIGPFGQCGDGLVCVEIDQFGGSCERLCNPFSAVDGQPSVCQTGSSCYPVDQNLGFCIPSLGQPEGSSCDRWNFGQPCDDGVVCTRRERQSFECMRICRRDLGDSDCIGGGRCGQAPGIQADGVGACR